MDVDPGSPRPLREALRKPLQRRRGADSDLDRLLPAFRSTGSFRGKAGGGPRGDQDEDEERSA